MDQRIRFHFTLANMMLMMVPLGAAAACIAYANSLHGQVAAALLTLIALMVFGSSAVGALADGWRGISIGLMFGLRLVYVVTILACILVIVVFIVAGSIYLVNWLGHEIGLVRTLLSAAIVMVSIALLVGIFLTRAR